MWANYIALAVAGCGLGTTGFGGTLAQDTIQRRITMIAKPV
jgi:hypothetical protein